MTKSPSSHDSVQFSLNELRAIYDTREQEKRTRFEERARRDAERARAARAAAAREQREEEERLRKQALEWALEQRKAEVAAELELERAKLEAETRLEEARLNLAAAEVAATRRHPWYSWAATAVVAALLAIFATHHFVTQESDARIHALTASLEAERATPPEQPTPVFAQLPIPVPIELSRPAAKPPRTRPKRPPRPPVVTPPEDDHRIDVRCDNNDPLCGIISR